MHRAACVFLFAGTVLAETSPYAIAPSCDARIELEVYKTGLMSGKLHRFLFAHYHGQLQYDAHRPANSRVRLVIESAAVSLQDRWVSDKDRRKIRKFTLEQMLAATEYPQILFVSERVTPVAQAEFQVTGTLTIRGIAKPVTATVRLTPGEPLWCEGSAVVNMKDYGLRPPKAALGLVGTKEEMTVRFRLAARDAR